MQFNDQQAYNRYADLVNKRPVATLRDLLALRSDIQPIDLSDVEPVEKLFPRFDTAAMSLGALSPEAHEALAMNDLGGRSNSGEGVKTRPVMAPTVTPKSNRSLPVVSALPPLIWPVPKCCRSKWPAKPGEGGRVGKVNDHLAARGNPDFTATAPRHLLHRRSGAADFRPEAGKPAGAGIGNGFEPGVGTIAAGGEGRPITISGYDGGTAAFADHVHQVRGLAVGAGLI